MALVFPEKLARLRQTPCIVFERLDAGPIYGGENMIVLPASGQINFDSSVDYNDQNLSVADQALLKKAPEAAKKITEAYSNATGGIGDRSKAAFGAVKDIAANVVADANKFRHDLLTKDVTQGNVSKLARLMASNFASGDVQTLMRLGVSGTMNKYVHTEFSGVRTRNFGFTFKMIADSEAESATIKSIWQTFQLASYPSAPTDTAKLLLLYPPKWKVKFTISGEGGAELENVPKIYDECYLTTCQVSFNDDTKNWYSPDPNNAGQCSPIACNLSLTFTESRSLTAEDISTLQSRGGGGAFLPGGR